MMAVRLTRLISMDSALVGIETPKVKPLFGGLLMILMAHMAFAGSPEADSATRSIERVRFDPHLLVDQFGYRPHDPKVAVVRSPQLGFDKGRIFSPAPKLQLRRASDGRVVKEGPLSAWNHGALEASSGDTGWWFDFSAIEKPGSYFIYDPTNDVRSAGFQIGPKVYNAVLKAAMRMYYYQRSGLPKRPPFADACWVDSLSYAAANQDTQAHDVTDRNNAGKVRNLSGGWFDAGDTNKYVTFAVPAVHQLLTAYQEHPAVFTDDFNIPESGNGIPDVLDEVKWETDWLKRMQFSDGSVALKVGEIVYATASPPSSDHNPRFYVPSCTSSTIAAAGMYAHGSYVFGSIPALKSESEELRARALAAWRNFQSISPKQTHCDTGIVHAGNADWSEQDQRADAVVAAIYLFAITEDDVYAAYVRAHYRELQPYREVGWSRYKPEEGEALLFFAKLPHVEPALSNAILSDKLSDIRAGNQIYAFAAADDLYRDLLPDPQYHWGSNQPRANAGNSNMDAITYKLAGADEMSLTTRALEAVHYFHGVNPFGMVYLSNMSRYGATLSANEIFHNWYAQGSRWSDVRTSVCGPAPGYVPGGPNASAVHDGVPSDLTPPAGQPAQKSYRDWNAGWPQSSWVVTEPGIYYQSAYVKLLSKFAQ
jgi:endoglucanase